MSEIYKKVVYPRIGLLGNPSDNFGGKTISTPFKNFQAEVVLWPSEKLKFVPNRQDQEEYDSLEELSGAVKKIGYYGGIRLIKAAIITLTDYCDKKNISYDREQNFTISYRADIPRQSGLAGSSAIITATVRVLMELWKISKKDIPDAVLANIVLFAETEGLGIAAGLQDRVVQFYQKPVYMDFSMKAYKKNRNIHGSYKVLSFEDMPELLLAWCDRPSDSGKVHSDVTSRHKEGDQEVTEAMEKFAKITEEGYAAIIDRDRKKMLKLMDENFDLRRSLYGDKVVGRDNIKMVELARSQGAAAKFPGSGGAIVILPKKKTDDKKIISKFKDNGYLIEKVVI